MSEQTIDVRCQGLTKRYEQLVALDHLDLEIPRGHVFGYIGHNGAGKTTTIRILAGLLSATEGKAELCGIDVSQGRDRIKQLVGYMPDAFGVYDQMRVWEYLDFFGAAFKIPKSKRRDRIDHVMEITDATYMKDRFVDTLSKGMKQRVGIARTLMHDPQVLLLDEPASGLDPQARVEMRHLLRDLADKGKTLLVSSHILPELAAICDSIGIIHKGKLKTYGPIQKVLSELSRDRIMEVRAAEGLTAAANLLGQADGVTHVDDADLTTGLLRFRFSGDDDATAALLARLLGEGVKVITFREVPLSLEDAYLSISGIGEQEPDEPAPDESADAQPAQAAQAGK